MACTTDLVERLERLGEPGLRDPRPSLVVVDATDDPGRVTAHRRLRADAFVRDQGLFAASDRDWHDDDPSTRVLVAIGADGVVLGGVRLHPAGSDGHGLGWWLGSRLVCDGGHRFPRGRVGAALVRAACAGALSEGALRFDAQVQAAQESFFARLGWQRVRAQDVHGSPHVLMRWPIDRIEKLARDTKGAIAGLVGELVGDAPGMDAWIGDDGAPLAGTDVVACTDAITPAMVERDPQWAGWCAMLVTAHDIAAMGAAPIGALDALAASDAVAAEQIVRGLRAGAAAFDLPVLGGHTQLGAHASLSVTGLGRTDDPVAAGGASIGDRLTVTADLDGGWRPGYRGRQWDSSSGRSRDEMRAMLDAVAIARPRAAKDVSMAGIVGTVGMLAEAGGCGAELDVAHIPRPDATAAGDWLTCFPGYGMVTADRAGAAPPPAGPATGAECGYLSRAPGVRLRWPDGEVTTALAGGVTGLGQASEEDR